MSDRCNSLESSANTKFSEDVVPVTDLKVNPGARRAPHDGHELAQSPHVPAGLTSSPGVQQMQESMALCSRRDWMGTLCLNQRGPRRSCFFFGSPLQYPICDPR